MFARDIEIELQELARGYPIITLIGPRQSGKTTLVRHAFPRKPYTSLEDPDTRSLADTDPRGFLERYPDGAIHAAQAIFSYSGPKNQDHHPSL